MPHEERPRVPEHVCRTKVQTARILWTPEAPPGTRREGTAKVHPRLLVPPTQTAVASALECRWTVPPAHLSEGGTGLSWFVWYAAEMIADSATPRQSWNLKLDPWVVRLVSPTWRRSWPALWRPSQHPSTSLQQLRGTWLHNRRRPKFIDSRSVFLAGIQRYQSPPAEMEHQGEGSGITGTVVCVPLAVLWHTLQCRTYSATSLKIWGQ